MPITKKLTNQPIGIPQLPKEPIQKAVEFPSFKILLMQAWEIYKKHTWKFVGMYLLLVVPAVVGGLLIAGVIGVASLAGNASLVTLAPLLFIPFLFAIIVGAYSMIFLIKGLDQNISIWQAYMQAWKYFWRYVLIFLMVFILVGLGFIALVIPGLVLLVWFSQVFFIAAFEDLGGKKALVRSKKLVQGYWWTILERFLFWLIAILVFNLLLVLPLIILSLAGLPDVILGIVQVLVSIIGLAANFVIIPVGTIYTYLMYKNIRTIKDKTPNAFDDMETGRKFGLVLLIIVYAILSAALDYDGGESDDNFNFGSGYEFDFD